MRNKTSNCLNCGKPVTDMNYCPECGQANTTKRISMRHLISDFFGDYFTFDSKIFRSILPLIFKPGFLTREYTEGRRRTYILPFRLYLFVTFIFFFVLAVSNHFGENENTVTVSPRTGQAMMDSLSLILDNYPVTIPKDVSKEIIAKLDTSFYRFNTGNRRKKGFIITNGDSADYTPKFQFNIESKDTTTISGKFISFVEKKAEFLSKQGSTGERMLIDGMINQLPKILFLLLPVFALLLKILYIRHKLYYVEHLIFSLHWHTFVFLLLIITVFFTNGWIFFGIFLITMIYLFMAMRYYYRQPVLKTLMKMTVLLPVYLLCIAGAGIALIFAAIIVAG